MSMIENDPRNLERGFSSPLRLNARGPIVLIDNRVILMGMKDRRILIGCPASIEIASEKYLEKMRQDSIRFNGDENRISKLVIKLRPAHDVYFISDYELRFDRESSEPGLFNLTLRSPRKMRIQEGISRSADFNRILALPRT